MHFHQIWWNKEAPLTFCYNLPGLHNRSTWTPTSSKGLILILQQKKSSFIDPFHLRFFHHYYWDLIYYIIVSESPLISAISSFLCPKINFFKTPFILTPPIYTPPPQKVRRKSFIPTLPCTLTPGENYFYRYPVLHRCTQGKPQQSTRRSQ